MEKSKTYDFTHFDAQAISDIFSRFKALDKTFHSGLLAVTVDEARWTHDNLNEFLADYRRSKSGSHVIGRGGKTYLSLVSTGGYQVAPDGQRVWGWETRLDIGAPERQSVEALFEIFESRLESARNVPAPKPRPKPEAPTVFIGHGHNPLWRDLKDHLGDLHGYRVEAFETGARSGHTIRDVLEDMLHKTSFALLVLTAEDEHADGSLHARQNVVHEAGLFQGRLGFSRAVLLLEDGCDEFTNIHGVQQIRFSTGNIKETFGDVLATLRREFAG
jgi:Predicted nucleotide-binding protein containing TIR -like domain